MAPPNNAGIRASLSASCGMTLANEIDRTAGTWWIELAPKGHSRCRVVASR